MQPALYYFSPETVTFSIIYGNLKGTTEGMRIDRMTILFLRLSCLHHWLRKLVSSVNLNFSEKLKFFRFFFIKKINFIKIEIYFAILLHIHHTAHF